MLSWELRESSHVSGTFNNSSICHARHSAIFQARACVNLTTALQSQDYENSSFSGENSGSPDRFGTCSGFQNLLGLNRIRKRQSRDLNPQIVWHWALNSWAPPPLNQLLRTLRALQGQWPRRPAWSSLQGNVLWGKTSRKCPQALGIPSSPVHLGEAMFRLRHRNILQRLLPTYPMTAMQPDALRTWCPRSGSDMCLSVSALLKWGPSNALFWGAVLCLAGCWATSLTFTQ